MQPLPSSSRRAALSALFIAILAPSVARADALEFAAEVSQRESCARQDVLCLDDHGRGLLGDALPPQVPAGTPITVKALGCSTAGVSITLVDSVVRTVDRLGREDILPKQDLTGEADPKPPACASAANVVLLKSAQFIVSSDVAVRQFVVGFSRVQKSEDGKTETLESVESHSTGVTHGRYYVDVGVLIPVVVGGDREVVLDDTDQDRVKRLRVSSDVAVFPALMLHVFPGGREFGALSSFSGGPTCRPGKLDLAHCRAARHRRRAANSLGVQAGIELDFKKFSRFYLGGLFEPVSGFSINAGVALTKQQYIRGGYYEGALVPTPTVVHADGTPDLSRYIEQRWVPRFYLGITLSIDILRYLGERRRSSSVSTILP